MSEPILFSVGLPFGQWPVAATSLAHVFAPGEVAVQRLLDEVFQAPALEVWPLDYAAAPPESALDDARILAVLSDTGVQDWRAESGDARLCWFAEPLAQVLPDSRFVLWVEHPARVYAHWLQRAGSAITHEAALALLRSSSQAMQQMLHRYPSQCLVVALDEASQHPAQFRETLGRWLGTNLAVEPRDVLLPELDALALTLAAHRVGMDRGLVRAHERLLGSCILLSDQTPAWQMAMEPAAAPVAMQALHVYSELSGRVSEIGSLQERAQLAENNSRLLAEARDLSAGQCALLLEQLHATQEELEVAFLQEQRAVAQLSALRGAIESPRVELALVRPLLAAQHRDQESEQPPPLSLLADKEQRDVQVATLTRQNELLMVQLHQVQEELEHYYLECQELELQANRPRAGQMLAAVGRIELGTAREAPPHRELTLILHEVSAQDRSRQRVSTRLVEHNGRPGLAFFAEEGYEPALLAWEPTGEEAGRDFMLFVPEDASSRLRLQHLGAGDWQFLLAVASAVVRHLEAATDGVPTRWSVMAQRLLWQLNGLPPRFRFDDIEIFADSSSAGSLLVRFRQVLLGTRPLASVDLCWQPTPTPRIEMLLSGQPDEAPAFTCWPTDEAGTWAQRWVVLAGGEQAHLDQHYWRAMGIEDRSKLLGVLDALPAAADRAGLSKLAGYPGAHELKQSAATALRNAQRQAHGSRLRRVWRALRGRVAL